MTMQRTRQHHAAYSDLRCKVGHSCPKSSSQPASLPAGQPFARVGRVVNGSHDFSLKAPGGELLLRHAHVNAAALGLTTTDVSERLQS